VLIDDSVVRGERGPLYWKRGQGAEFWAVWAGEEEEQNKTRDTTL
jgi:ATP-dependent Clp protease ATP-binding subunit ClpX